MVKKGNYEICAMGVQLATSVIGLQVQLGLIDETYDLDIVGSPHPLDTLESTPRNETSAVAWRGTPRDHLGFCVCHELVRGGRSPKTEV